MNKQNNAFKTAKRLIYMNSVISSSYIACFIPFINTKLFKDPQSQTLKYTLYIQAYPILTGISTLIAHKINHPDSKTVSSITKDLKFLSLANIVSIATTAYCYYFKPNIINKKLLLFNGLLNAALLSRSLYYAQKLQNLSISIVDEPEPEHKVDKEQLLITEEIKEDLNEDEWDEDCISHRLVIKSGDIVKYKKSNKYGVWANAFLTREVNKGKHHWKFKIISVKQSLLIGIWNNSMDIDLNEMIGKRAFSAYVFNATYARRNIFEKADEWTVNDSYCVECQGGWTVDMYLDMDQLQLWFVVNGWSDGEKIKVENYTYTAVVSSGYPTNKVQLVSYFTSK